MKVILILFAILLIFYIWATPIIEVNKVISDIHQQAIGSANVGDILVLQAKTRVMDFSRHGNRAYVDVVFVGPDGGKALENAYENFLKRHTDPSAGGKWTDWVYGVVEECLNAPVTERSMTFELERDGMIWKVLNNEDEVINKMSGNFWSEYYMYESQANVIIQKVN